MTVSNFTYEELRDLYKKYFTLGYINGNIKDKFALISLVCFMCHRLKEKDPDITPYRLLKKLTKNDVTIPENFIWAVSIICEDYMYMATDFPTFGVALKDIPSTIQNLLNKYLPF